MVGVKAVEQKRRIIIQHAQIRQAMWLPLIRVRVAVAAVEVKPRIITVSYTHLDVYKRQSQPAASSTRSACGVAQDSPPRWPRLAIDRM